MSEYESDFTSENPDDTSRDGSHPPRTNRNGSPVKPGQRGRGKRELGEKPLVTVKWDEPMTNQLWQMIKEDPELRPVLATETTKSLVTPTKSSMTYSKKDLQRRIAETLWKDTHDINDPQILENLTRAVKNKIHKTYLLYDQVIKGLGPEFIHYNSEIDVPPEAQSKWAKAKERFPTFFAFQTLKQEYEESERRAGSTPNGLLQSPHYHNSLLLRHLAQNPHFLSLAQGGEGLEMPSDFGLGFEVVPPPADLTSDLSDGEPVHRFSANHPNRSPSHSPFAQPGPLINPHNRRHLDASGRTGPAPGHASKQSSTGSTFSFPSVSVSQTTSPLQDPTLLLPDNPTSSLRQPTDGASSQTRVVLSTDPAAQSYPVVGADRRVQSPLLGPMISASPTALPTSPSGIGFTHNLESLNLSPGLILSPHRSTDALASATQTSVILPLLRRTARRPKDPLSASNSAVGHSSGNTTSKPATFSPQQPQHASINRLTAGVGAPKSPLSSNQALAVRPGTAGSHKRSYSDTMDASSTFSEQRDFSQSPSPPLPDRDSPPLTTALESLIDMHREKEVQKRKREEMWVEHKRKRYEDRQRQREENERQRQENERHRRENERQRQHQEKMMEMKLELAKLSAAKEKARAEGKQAQSQAKLSPGSVTGNGSGGKSQVPLPGSTITSPTAVLPPLNGADASPIKSPATISRSLGSTSTSAGDKAVGADRSGEMSLGLSLEVDHMSQQQYPSPSSRTGGYPGLPFTNIEQSNSLNSLLQPKYPSIQQQLSRQYAPHAQHQQAYLPQRPPVQVPPSQPRGASAMDTPASISLGSMDLALPYEEFSLTSYDYPMSSLPPQHTPSQQQHLSLTSQPYQSPAMHPQMQCQPQMHQQPQGQFMEAHDIDHRGLVLGLDGSHPTFDMFSDSLLMMIPPSEHQHPSSQEQAPHHQPTYYHANG